MSESGRADEAPLPQTLGAIATNGLAALPEWLSKSAVGAINRVIAGAAEIPAAWLSGKKEEIEDKNFERRLFRRRMSEAVVNSASTNDDVLYRAVDRFISEQGIKQANREKIAAGALSYLESYSEAPKNEGPSKDWTTKFSRYCEDDSNEEAQKIWSKLLANEIRKPGSFSVKSLSLLSEMDTETAVMFSKIVDMSLGNIIPKGLIGENGDLFSYARILQDFGLLSGVTGGLVKSLKWDDSSAKGGLIGRRYYFDLNAPGYTPKIPAIFLTQAGNELAALVEADEEQSVIEYIFSQLDKSRIAHAFCWHVDPSTSKTIGNPRIMHKNDNIF